MKNRFRMNYLSKEGQRNRLVTEVKEEGLGHYRARVFPDGKCMDFFEMELKPYKMDLLRLETITKNHSGLGGFGIPDALIPELVRLTGKEIVSSDPEKEGEIHSCDARKMWKRLAGKGFALEIEGGARYKCSLPSLSSKAVEKLTILDREVQCLHADWKLFEQCFCQSTERSELLYEAAGGFWTRAHDMMLWGVVVSICRVLDPAGFGKRSNLTLEALRNDLDTESLSGVSGRVSVMLRLIRCRAREITSFRNKRVGHLDEMVLLGRTELTGFGPEIVTKVLLLLDDLLNTLNVLVPGKGIVVYDSIHIYDDADVLARCLSKAKALDRLIKEGKVSDKDARSAGAYDG